MTGSFRMGTRVVAGLGALADVRGEVDRLEVSRLAVVADSGLARIAALDPILDMAGISDRISLTLLTDVDSASGPIEQAARAAAAAGVDAVVGVGGGSGLGAAKAIALLLNNDLSLRDMEGVDRAARLPAPVIAIPTTAGSGSEVSNALVVHEPGLVREIVVRGDGYEPRTAILDAVVLRGLPREQLMLSALDALTHAIEACWTHGATLFTDACALRAAAEIIDSLPQAVNGADDGRNRAGDNDESLQRLLEAACLANIACGNSGLGLVHALSSSPLVELPHGLQNGILLPHVARFNRDVVSGEALELLSRIPALYDEIEFEARFAERSADADAMLTASRGHVFRANNRRESTDEQLRVLLTEAGARSAGQEGLTTQIAEDSR